MGGVLSALRTWNGERVVVQNFSLERMSFVGTLIKVKSVIVLCHPRIELRVCGLSA